MTQLPDGVTRIGDWRTPGPYRGALVLPFDDDGRVLLQLRDDRKGVVEAGKWGFFGGGVEPGEDWQTAVMRELEEETGIALDAGAFTPAYATLTGAPRWGLLCVFTAQLPVLPEAIRLREGAGFGFVTKGQAQRLDMITHLRPVLDEFWKDQKK